MSEFDQLKNDAEQEVKDHPQQVHEAEQDAEHAVESKFGGGDGQQQGDAQSQGAGQNQDDNQNQGDNPNQGDNSGQGQGQTDQGQ